MLPSSAATLRLYERPEAGASWQLVHPAEPVVAGARGAGWSPWFRHLAREGDPMKREGDQRTPAGIYALGPSFGFAASPLPGYRQLDRDAVCVDDPASPAYNTITSRGVVGAKVSGEDMRRSPLYRRGIVVQYPTDAAARAGSCIFIHVWRNPGSGTAGCLALPEARVAALQEFAAQAAVLAILPAAALERLADCLPPVQGRDGQD
jgi:D-alanyl-D-alanine dipeptidase